MKKKNQEEIFLGQFLSRFVTIDFVSSFCLMLNRASQSIFMGVCVSLTHYFVTLCVCVCVCVCVCMRVCVCVCDKHLHIVPYKRGCKNSWIA